MSSTAQEDALIAAAQAGSAQAWEQLVRHYERRVYNYGLRLTGNPADALDLMQEVFIGVYRNLREFRGDAQFTSWMFRIAHNKAVDMNRRQRPLAILDVAGGPGHRENGRLEDSDQGDEFDNWPDEITPTPDASVAEAQVNSRISSMLGALSWEQRAVVELKIYQDLTFEEIAAIQDISVNTAKTRFYSALKKLRTLMEHDHVM